MAHWLHKTVQRLSDKPDARVWAVYANRSLHRLLFDTIEEAQRSTEHAGEFSWKRVELLHIKDILELLFS